MMTRSELFRVALGKVKDLCSSYPTDQAARSIRMQLEYLVDLEEGKRTDVERLNEIIIGVLTVREIEPLDMDAAELLYNVVEQVELMKHKGEVANKPEL